MDKMVASSGDLVGSPSISEKNPGQLNSFTIQLADWKKNKKKNNGVSS